MVWEGDTPPKEEGEKLTMFVIQVHTVAIGCGLQLRKKGLFGQRQEEDNKAFLCFISPSHNVVMSHKNNNTFSMFPSQACLLLVFSIWIGNQINITDRIRTWVRFHQHLRGVLL